MIKTQKNIQIVRSTNKGLSSMSQKSHDAIYDVLCNHFTQVSTAIVNTPADLDFVAQSRPDLVFLGMKYVREGTSVPVYARDKIWIADYLEEHAIAHTGSCREAIELEQDKPSAKQRVLEAGLRTARFVVVRQTDQCIDQFNLVLDYPLFVKPANRGGSMGIDEHSVVYDHAQLQAKVHSIINDIRSDVLIEEFLPGREFSVAILKDPMTREYQAIPIERIVPAGLGGVRILSNANKNIDAGESLTLDTDPILKSIVCKFALQVFHALGAQDYGRIDIRLDAHDNPHFIEANLIPSLIENYGNFAKACELNQVLGYEDMILRIVELGLQHSVATTVLV